MAVYPGQAGSDIGTLLKMIQQDKSNSPTAVLPSSEQGSPIRNLVQEPLASPEAPTSSHVVSTPAEGSTAGVVAPVMPTSPIAPIPGNAGSIPTGTLLSNAPVAPKVVAPVAPAPAPTPSMPRIGTSIGSSASIGPSKAQSVSMPTTNTSISAAPSPAPQQNTNNTQSLMNLLKSFFGGTPFRSTIGQPVAQPSGPTPTPNPSQKQKGSAPSFRTSWLA
jgi:hypothetical protein